MDVRGLQLKGSILFVPDGSPLDVKYMTDQGDAMLLGEVAIPFSVTFNPDAS